MLPLVLLVYAVPYAIRARALRRTGRRVPAGRMACFAAGLVVLGAALSAPVGALADRRFAGHMAEHLALGDVAPLLLVAGCTGPLLAPVLRLPVARALRGLGHPAVAIVVWAATLSAWHLPAAYDLTLRSEAAHAAEHTMFFFAGLALWAALLGPLPKPACFGPAWRLGYVSAVWLVTGVLGGALAFSARPVYAHYEALLGPGAAADDQSVGGALMLVEGTAVAVVVFCWLFLRLFEAAGERQDLQELAAARGVAVDPRRLDRAVDAGAAETLRRRLEERPRP
jgi:putative membrane protein